MQTDLIPAKEFDSGAAVLAAAQELRTKHRAQCTPKPIDKSDPKPPPVELTREERIERIALMSREFIKKNKPPKLVFKSPPPPPLPPVPMEPRFVWDSIETKDLDLSEFVRREPWMDTMASRVAAVHGITTEELFSKRRPKALSEARHHFYYLARKYTSHSYPSIGRYCGRDHTTVLHGDRVHERRKELRHSPAERQRRIRERREQRAREMGL